MNTKKVDKSKIMDLISIAVFTALLVILTQISIPIPGAVPVTLQTFAIALCGFLYGYKRAPIVIIVYIALGLIGLPVFSGFQGGLSALLGYTGGFIWGFLPFSFFTGLGAKQKNKIISISFAIVGLVICHILGVLQFSFVSSKGFAESTLIVSLPYLIKDSISIVLAWGIALAIQKSLKHAGIPLFADAVKEVTGINHDEE